MFKNFARRQRSIRAPDRHNCMAKASMGSPIHTTVSGTPAKISVTSTTNQNTPTGKLDSKNSVACAKRKMGRPRRREFWAACSERVPVRMFIGLFSIISAASQGPHPGTGVPGKLAWPLSGLARVTVTFFLVARLLYAEEIVEETSPSEVDEDVENNRTIQTATEFDQYAQRNN